MFNKIFFLIKRVIVSMFIIYTYNYFSISFDKIIPINTSNVFLISAFGVVAMFELIIFSFVC